MLVRTPKNSAEDLCTLYFVGPSSKASSALKVMKELGFRDARESLLPQDTFSQWSDAESQGKVLQNARRKEGLTQVKLSEQTGIPQRHISEIENGKRRIGKERAKKLAIALDVNYKALI